jgi:hypothetical protein
VLVQDSDAGALVQELCTAETAAQDPAGRGTERDWEMKGSIQEPGPTGGRPVHKGGLGLPQPHGCGEEGSAGQGGGGGIQSGGSEQEEAGEE